MDGRRRRRAVGDDTPHRRWPDQASGRRGVRLAHTTAAPFAKHQEILDPARMGLRDQFALYSHYLQSVAARSH